MHIADEKVNLALKQSSSASDQQQQSQGTSATTTGTTASTDEQTSSSSSSNKIQAMTQVPHERNKFIEELCQTFFDLFTDYWRLGTMYLNNLLTISRTDITAELKSNNSLSLLVKEITRKKTPDDFYGLVGNILTTFSDIVRAAFIPHTFSQDKEKDSAQSDADTSSSSSANTSTSARTLFMPWPIQHDAKIISQILPHCLRSCRLVDLAY